MGVIAKQSIRGTIVTYLGIGVGIITTFFVLTRFLTSEEIGLARVLIDAATLFVGLAQLGTNNSIIRFYPYFKDKNGDHGFSSGHWWYRLSGLSFLRLSIGYAVYRSAHGLAISLRCLWSTIILYCLWHSLCCIRRFARRRVMS